MICHVSVLQKSNKGSRWFTACVRSYPRRECRGRCCPLAFRGCAVCVRQGQGNKCSERAASRWRVLSESGHRAAAGRTAECGSARALPIGEHHVYHQLPPTNQKKKVFALHESIGLFKSASTARNSIIVQPKEAWHLEAFHPVEIRKRFISQGLMCKQTARPCWSEPLLSAQLFVTTSWQCHGQIKTSDFQYEHVWKRASLIHFLIFRLLCKGNAVYATRQLGLL